MYEKLVLLLESFEQLLYHHFIDIKQRVGSINE